MRNIIFSITLFFTSPLLAQLESIETPDANTESLHSMQVSTGFTEGGFSIGLDYEYAYHRTYGLGGFVRLYPEENDANAYKGGITSFGIFARPHFTRHSWDFYVSPGLAFSQEEVRNKDESFLGPVLIWGMLFQFQENFAGGLENTKLYGWFGDEEVRGLRSDAYLAKFRYSFN